MLLNFSTTIQQARLAAIKDNIDSGSAGGKLKIYSGTKPTPGASITDQVLLATITFADPCGTISGNTLTFAFAGSGEAQCAAGGTATWARFTSSADVFCADADVSDTNGNGVIKIDSVTLYQNGTVRVLNGVLLEP